MKSRCFDKKNPNYKYYGGRGIWLDRSWRLYENFLADMGERPEGHTLDRINNDGPYTKDNCRWATPAQQAASRRPAEIRFGSKTDIVGVNWQESKDRFVAQGTKNRTTTWLYRGKDFFEACCARKSWENHQFK